MSRDRHGSEPGGLRIADWRLATERAISNLGHRFVNMQTIESEEACRNCQVILTYDYELENGRWNGRVGGDFTVKDGDQVFLECPSCGARNFLRLGDDERFHFSHQDF